MSDFIFVIPEGWMQVSDEVVNNVGAASMAGLASSGMFSGLTDVLREQGAIGPEDNIYDAKMFNNEILVIKLG